MFNSFLNDTISFIEAFINHLKYERRVSHHTLKSYGHDLKTAQDFFIGKGLDSWQAVSEENIRSLIVCRRQQKKSARSINRQLSSLRTFYEYLIREDYLKLNPVKNI